jgi:sugar phosphate permease
VFVALAALSGAFAIASWVLVRDRPEDEGFPPVNLASRAAGPPQPWTRALRQVVSNPATWPGFFVNVGVGGSFLAFAGLWAVPYLVEVHGMRQVTAAQHASALLLGVAVGALLVGAVSDRLGNRRVVMRVYTALYALTWTPWILDVRWPLPATLAWFALMGLLVPGFALTWVVAKEVNRPEHSGMATSVVNVGVFLGTGLLQPIIGWQLDSVRIAGNVAGAWSRGILILAGAAAFGAACALCVRERLRPDAPRPPAV